MKKAIFISIVLFVSVLETFAQHEHHHEMKKDTLKPMHDHHGDSEMSSMSHAFSLNLPMNRNGSGTGWLPDASPMYGDMKHSNDWMFMMHGSLFLRYNNQDFSNKGVRGDNDFDAPNWFMVRPLTLDPSLPAAKTRPLDEMDVPLPLTSTRGRSV